MGTRRDGVIAENIQRGVVVKFDAQRGFGFIRPAGMSRRAEADSDVFVHVRHIPGRRPLHPGQRVTYQVTSSEKGLTAINVQPGSVLATPYIRFGLIGFGGALLLLLGLALVLHRESSVWLWTALWMLSLSVATFAIFRYDKWQAEARGTRVPELVLHLLSALGGTPGAFIGMRWPSHHKTGKAAFQGVFWLIVAAQAGIIGFFVVNR